ncbi:hypothetical protein SVEN_6393 [Streptomyces venezuelae ATCC 10712]|uniref:Uncharacterized protein n=1 Tax=Streptomyces venezuelae (strain ATCC 10712 / CBS 650.69 / DSM 40230 / JCM 4526 / NBRC 13096 / PD 04745) TaxID=953739 RepID=F2REZ4_STRVP|nr:hypothetical protein SVEN_6393 [Streptomyces venezuelae ATCC 10712]
MRNPAPATHPRTCENVPRPGPRPAPVAPPPVRATHPRVPAPLPHRDITVPEPVRRSGTYGGKTLPYASRTH